MHRNKATWICTLLCALPLLAGAKPLNWDPDVVRGELDNGMQFFIRRNPKPADRVELRLAVNAGSVLEDDDQRGLAHFLEHMAFNGTEHFAKQELVDYLESVGMRFGPDLNAYTSFDETVYMLQSRTDQPEQLDKAFLVLREWASAVANEGEEIDKERGVILEERRLRRGASQRIRDKQLPVLFQGSKYAERMPIGTEEVLTTFPHERLRDFYQTWYRPDLMALVVVGDADPADMEKLIRKHFGALTVPDTPLSRPSFSMPDHAETLISVATDKEATDTSVSLYHKMEASGYREEADFRRRLIERLVNGMLNQRLSERAREADAPFLGAGAFKGNYVRGLGVYGLGVDAREGEARRGLEAVLEESERARRHGFTAPEFDRVKSEILRGAERAFHEKDTTDSRNFAGAYVNAFLKEEVSVGPAAQYELTRRLLPEIPLEEINRSLDEWMTLENRVLLASAPEKDGLAVPDGDALLAVIEASRRMEVSPYEDTVPDVPLVAETGKPGKVTARSRVEELDLTQWTLSNGAVVWFKPTPFKKDQVLMNAWSAGGHSRMAVDQLIPGRTATDVVGEGGLGAFSRIQLDKKLSGKIAGISPYIDELQEGFSGSCSPADLETMLQLLYLNFTAPRPDEEAFSALQTRAREYQENRLLEPLEQYGDMIQRTMSQDHPRREPMNVEKVDAYDLEASLALFQDRFTGPGDFSFLFVGAIDPDTLEPLVRKYIGSLPAGRTEETWADLGIAYPTGNISRELKRGLEPKSRVEIVFSGPMTWTLEERHALTSLTSAMNIRLREVLREDLGGTYSIGVYPVAKPFPKPEYRLVISFSCDPARVDELLAAAYAEVAVFQDQPFEDKYLQKVKEAQLRRRETQLEQNGFWLGQIKSFSWLNEDPRLILSYPERVEAIDTARLLKAAKQYLGTETRAQFVLKPEAEVPAAAETAQ